MRTTRIGRSLAREVDAMRYDETALCVAGSPVRAYRAGAGPPLVLLHGDGANCARRSWEPVWAALAARALVLAPDLPGFGGSPLGSTRPTPAAYAGWLLAFLDRCGVPVAALAGCSLGARVAVRVAAAAPARVTALALVGVEFDGVARCPVLLLPPGDDLAGELVRLVTGRAPRTASGVPARPAR
jgi:pimeloyl-ACP methyl ester carboxylesterase